MTLAIRRRALHGSTLASHSCLKEDIEAIQKAISDLRSANINADANRTADAVKHLSNLSDGVLGRYCKEDAPSR